MSQQRKIYFTRKRRRDEEIEKQLKQLKAESTTEIAPSTFQTKLTDVNDDCLEKVFMYLSLDDLFNIAHTNTELKPAADMVFARKFGKKLFNFFITTSNRNTVLNCANIHDLKSALRLLRCYGHLISNLSITCLTGSSYPTAPNKVLLYTSPYCFESLRTISFHGMREHMFETSVEKPLTKVETVTFDSCVLGEESSKLSTWFPAIRYLILKRSRLTDRSSIETHFPHLEELDFLNSYFTSENAMAVLRLNPQLRRISLHGLQSSENLKSASQYLRVLKHLTVKGFPKHFSSDVAIHFKSVRKLEMIFTRCSSDVLHLNLLFDQLEEVDIYLDVHTLIDGTLEFFKKHPSIVKLKLTYNCSTSQDYMMSIVTALPLLNVFFFFGTSLSVEKIVHFLIEFNLLNNFCFNISNRDEFRRLETILGNEWESSINEYQRVELKRRT